MISEFNKVFVFNYFFVKFNGKFIIIRVPIVGSNKGRGPIIATQVPIIGSMKLELLALPINILLRLPIIISYKRYFFQV